MHNANYRKITESATNPVFMRVSGLSRLYDKRDNASSIQYIGESKKNIFLLIFFLSSQINKRFHSFLSNSFMCCIKLVLTY